MTAYLLRRTGQALVQMQPQAMVACRRDQGVDVPGEHDGVPRVEEPRDGGGPDAAHGAPPRRTVRRWASATRVRAKRWASRRSSV